MRVRLLLASLALFSFGCLSAGIPCDTESQCYTDQVCSDGFCVTPGGGGGGGGGGSAGPCEAVAAGLCQDVYEGDDESERNDRRIDAEIFRPNDLRRVGCDNDEILIPADGSRDGALCAGDADFFTVQYIECRDQDFELTAKLTIDPVCAEGVVVLNAYFNGAKLVCGFNENVSFTVDCDPAPDGSPQRRLVLPRSGRPSVNSLYFEVSTAEGVDAGFEYVLSLTSEPIDLMEGQ